MESTPAPPATTVIIARTANTRLLNAENAKGNLKGFDAIMHSYMIGFFAWKGMFKPAENPN